MSAKIIKGTDVLEITNTTILLFGEPDIGKTSTAFTAKKPLLLDCDQGAHRSKFRKDAFRDISWTDIENIHQASYINDYETIIVDTVGRLLEMISMNKNKRAIPASHQEWGKVKTAFFTWLNNLRSIKKDVVLLAHAKTERLIENNNTRYYTKPDIQGSSYEEVFKVCDAVGYLQYNNNQRAISFDGSQRVAGKNAPRIRAQLLPDYNVDDAFLAGLLSHIKTTLSGMANSHIEMGEDLKLLMDKVEQVTDVVSANNCFVEIKCAETLKAVKAAACRKLIDDCAAKRIFWDKEKEYFFVMEDADESGINGVSADAESSEQPTAEQV